MEDPRKRSAPLEGYDEVYKVYAESSKRRKHFSDCDYCSLALKNFGEAAQALSQAQQQLTGEHTPTAKASAEIATLRNEFEDQIAKANQKYDADIQSAGNVVSQLHQELQDVKQRAEAAQQQIIDLRTQATAQIGEWERKYREDFDRAGAVVSRLDQELQSERQRTLVARQEFETLKTQATAQIGEWERRCRETIERTGAVTFQAQNQIRMALEERNRALARATGLENSRRLAELRDAGRLDPVQKYREEANATIAGFRDQLNAKENTISGQAVRIKQLEEQFVRSGGNVSSQQQGAANMLTPPAETATAGLVPMFANLDSNVTTVSGMESLPNNRGLQGMFSL